MRIATPKDQNPWRRAGSLMLALGGLAVLPPHTPAQAQPPAVVRVGITTPTAPADDGDGDELLEHWGDPKYSHEQRVQFVGMAVFFAGLGAVSLRRRAALGRSSRHD